MSTLDCTCGNAAPPGTGYQPGWPYCTHCTLKQRRPAYQERSSRPRLLGRPSPALPCIHRGPATGAHTSCVRCPVYACSKHGGCTINVKTLDHPCCRNCPDRCEGDPAMALCRCDQAHAGLSVDEMVELIRQAPPGPWPGDWAKWDCTRDAILVLLEEAIANLPAYPEGRFAGRGIVSCVSAKPGFSSGKHLAHGYFPGAWCMTRELRRLGCTLPVTYAHLGLLEWDTALTRLARQHLGVGSLDLRQVEEHDPDRPRILAGWESKCYAILQCPYEEVLFIDADNLPQADPEYLFDSSQYRYYGAVFWPDVPPPDRQEWLPACVWRNVGLDYRDEVDFESGQIVVNKRKCWRELCLTMWLNAYSDYFYRFLFGDKSTFHLAWSRLGSNWAMPPTPAGGNPGSLFQHDFAGRVLFQHLTRNKPDLHGFPSPGHLLRARECAGHLEELGRLWSGRLWDPATVTPRERALASELEGTIWTYTRQGLDSRPLRLVQDGRVGRGLAKKEVGWAVFLIGDEPLLILSGLDGEPTAALSPTDRGGWQGRWLDHERCVCTLTPEPGGES